MRLPVGRSGWAIASGYSGLFAVIILPAPVALFVSIISIWDTRKSSPTPPDIAVTFRFASIDAADPTPGQDLWEYGDEITGLMLTAG